MRPKVLVTKMYQKVLEFLKNLTNPELDWRELLNTNIQSVVKNDFTFMRPARKGIAERVTCLVWITTQT